MTSNNINICVFITMKSGRNCNEKSSPSLKTHTRKNIKKIKNSKHVKLYSACSINTLPESKTNSVNEQAIYSMEIKPVNPKKTEKIPTVISPLKSILSSTQNISPMEDLPDTSLCHYLLLRDRTKHIIKEFKLFKEDTMPLFSQNLIQASLNTPGYDNDGETDNEQIKNGIKAMEQSIIEGIKSYRAKKDEINNIEKYKKSKFSRSIKQ